MGDDLTEKSDRQVRPTSCKPQEWAKFNALRILLKYIQACIFARINAITQNSFELRKAARWACREGMHLGFPQRISAPEINYRSG